MVHMSERKLCFIELQREFHFEVELGTKEAARRKTLDKEMMSTRSAIK